MREALISSPIDIYRALPDRFQIIDGKLMPALNTIEGMGDNAQSRLRKQQKTESSYPKMISVREPK